MNELLTELERNREVIGEWHIERVKTGMPYITFSSTESIQSICDYLRQSPPLKLETPLFRGPKEKAISKDTFHWHFTEINKRAGFGKQGRQIFFHSHVMRKMFATMLHGEGVDKLMCDWMIGHKIDDITNRYFISNPKKLKREYLKIMEHVSVEKVKTVRVETDEFKELVSKMNELEKKDQETEEMVKIIVHNLDNPEFIKDVLNK
jgi:integrase